MEQLSFENIVKRMSQNSQEIAENTGDSASTDHSPQLKVNSTISLF